jgi:hypothetical protein
MGWRRRESEKSGDRRLGAGHRPGRAVALGGGKETITKY